MRAVGSGKDPTVCAPSSPSLSVMWSSVRSQFEQVPRALDPVPLTATAVARTGGGRLRAHDHCRVVARLLLGLTGCLGHQFNETFAREPFRMRVEDVKADGVCAVDPERVVRGARNLRQGLRLRWTRIRQLLLGFDLRDSFLALHRQTSGWFGFWFILPSLDGRRGIFFQAPFRYYPSRKPDRMQDITRTASTIST